MVLILINFYPGQKSEALSIFYRDQPIEIMYSLMMIPHGEQLFMKDTPINHYLHSIIAEKVDEKNEKKVPERETPESQVSDQDSSSQKDDSESVKEGTIEQEPVTETDNMKTVYLTFDDGPSAFTSNILDTLRSYQMKATFFMLEPNMRAYPDQLKQIIDQGHIPALHGVTHNISKIYRSEKTVVDEMYTGQQTLLNLTGTITHLIRTPYGSAPYMKPEYKEAVKAAGFQLWDWTIDSQDWKYQNAEYVTHVINQLENYRYPESPIVILLHDRKTTAEHLPALLDYLQTNGYHTEILTEKLAAYHF